MDCCFPEPQPSPQLHSQLVHKLSRPSSHYNKYSLKQTAHHSGIHSETLSVHQNHRIQQLQTEYSLLMAESKQLDRLQQHNCCFMNGHIAFYQQELRKRTQEIHHLNVLFNQTLERKRLAELGHAQGPLVMSQAVGRPWIAESRQWARQ